MKKIYIFVAVHCSLLALLLTSCEKVSPIGVLVSGTGVEDRVKMSHLYYEGHRDEMRYHLVWGDYSFLVGADSHMTTDDGRMSEMLQIGIDNNDLFCAHLGDIADTKAEYYIDLENVIDKYKKMYAEKHYVKTFVGDEDDPEQVASDEFYVYKDLFAGKVYKIDDVPLPFYPVVGNHDITHNGWALWSNIFHSSFYQVPIFVLGENGIEAIDHLIFLDTASGTLGDEQVKQIEEGVVDGDEFEKEYGIKIRNRFVFSHTNIFRPRSVEFASTFPREEMFFLLDRFAKWNANIVFLGHVHKWDYQMVNGVEYLTLDSMCEANNPDPGDYLVRVHCKEDGSISWEHVRMNYTPKKK